jgi:hypothetical protein
MKTFSDSDDRPRTGAESVSPPPPGSGREARLMYLLDVRRAEMAETASEAVERCRAVAARFDRQRVFDGLMAELLRVFDATAADTAYSGMTLDEAGFFDEYQLADLMKHWRELQVAFGDHDRECFRKAAAKFAGSVTVFTVGVVEQ